MRIETINIFVLSMYVLQGRRKQSKIILSDKYVIFYIFGP